MVQAAMRIMRFYAHESGLVHPCREDCLAEKNPDRFHEAWYAQ